MLSLIDENLDRDYKLFEAAPPEEREPAPKKQVPDYFL